MSKDRGRTRVLENGDEIFELFHEAEAQTSSVPYSYFTPRADGRDELEILMPTRQTIIPLPHDIGVDAGSLEELWEKEEGTVDEDDLPFDPENDDIGLELVADLETATKWAKQQYEDSAEIVQTENEAFWKTDWFKAAVLFIGGGLFFILLGIGYSEVISRPLIEKIDNLMSTLDTMQSSESLSQGLIPTLMFLGNRKIRGLKDPGNE